MYVAHKLLANGANLLTEGGTEHHDLFVVGSHLEDFLHILSHIYKSKINKYRRWREIVSKREQHNKKGMK
jgi:hypothetical protein